MKRIPLTLPAEWNAAAPVIKLPSLAQWQLKLRGFILRRRRLLACLRVLSAVFWLGPWRGWAVRYYQWRDRNQPLPRTAETLFAGLDATHTAAQLETAGFARGLQLPAAQVEAIHAYCTINNRARHGNPHLTCPVINDIAHDPALLAVAKAYLGTEPILYCTQMYWTRPPAGDAQHRAELAHKARFHYDLGDFKALVVFLYLTDVADDCGPHTVIPGTHRHKSWRQLLTRRLPDDEAAALYGDRITTVTGPRGSGFFEDLVCYHKHSFGNRERLMLSITYVLQRPPELPATKS